MASNIASLDSLTFLKGHGDWLALKNEHDVVLRLETSEARLFEY